MNKITAQYFQNQAIKEAILQSNLLGDARFSYVEFLCQPVFTNDFLLQLVWQEKTVCWYRTTWLQDQDQEMLALWLDYLQDEDEILPLELTFLRESGEIDSVLATDLIQKISTLSIHPILFDDGQWGRDGKEIILKIGSEKSYSVFHWYTCATPAGWETLDDLAKSILHLNQELR